jgi:hypothetical protein
MPRTIDKRELECFRIADQLCVVALARDGRVVLLTALAGESAATLHKRALRLSAKYKAGELAARKSRRAKPWRPRERED